MSIKYNQFGEVVSVNGITTGHHLGTPMQDAIAKRPEDNEAYAIANDTIGNSEQVVDDEQPEDSGGSVLFDKAQELTEEQKEQARKNIGIDDGEAQEHTWESLPDKPFYEESNVILDGSVSVSIGSMGTSGIIVARGDIQPSLYGLLEEGKYYSVIINGKRTDNVLAKYDSDMSIVYLGTPPATIVSAGFGDEKFYIPERLNPTMIEYDYAGKPSQYETISIQIIENTVKTIDPKFLPADAGGGSVPTIFRIITIEENDEYKTSYSCNKTYDEVVADYFSGNVLTFIYTEGTRGFAYSGYHHVLGVWYDKEQDIVIYTIADEPMPDHTLYGTLDYYKDGTINFGMSTGE